ncbi:Structural maintenance of chromosomes protein 1 [Rhodotorula toruloides]
MHRMLEGTVIHRSGTITGGTSQQGGRHFEDQEVESLRRREAELRGKLADVFKNRPKVNAEEQLINDETRLKADLQVVRDDLSSTESRLKGVRDELKTLRKKAADSQKTISQIEDELEQLEAQAATCRDVIDREEDAIFADFCRRIRVANIREYEEKQLRGAQEDNAQMLVFNTQVARLNHQIAFQSEQVDGTRERLESLHKLADKQRKALEQLRRGREVRMRVVGLSYIA